MKQFVLTACLFFLYFGCLAQTYNATSGTIQFFSKAPIEDIEATNHEVRSAIDIESGEIVFSLDIDDFEFEKALMQQHFNEKFMESDQYPKSTFQGKIINASQLQSKTSGAMKVRGNLEIHGVRQPIETVIKLEKKSDEQLDLSSEFKVLLKDYQIKRPKLLFRNIAEEILIKVSMRYAEEK